MKKNTTNENWDKKRLIIESIVAILIAIAGIVCGKSTNTYYYNGEKISEVEFNTIMQENTDLITQNKSFELLNKELNLNIEKLENENKKLKDEYNLINNQISNIPSIKFENLKLSIDGEERNINENKSSVIINGSQYFSQDFVDNLLPTDKITTIKDNTMYIGKVIKDKCNLIDQQVIGQTKNAFIENNIKDTYGKIHNKAVVFAFLNDKITFCTNREYSNLKFKIAVKDGKKGGGIIQISSDKDNIFTTEEEITYLYEPIEIDISINQSSTITIECISNNSDPCIMITDAVLYNEE